MTKRLAKRAAPAFFARRRLLRAAMAERSGVAAVEFALILPILVFVLLATVDFSLYIVTRLELEQALRAGGQYALDDFTDTTTITSAVLGATNLTGITVTVGSLFCECPGGTSAVCRGQSNYTNCTGGISPAAFLNISGTVTHNPLFFDYLSWFTSDMTVQQDVTLRVR